MEPGVSLTSDFISLQSMFEILVPKTWSALQFPYLQLPKLPFPESPFPQRASSPATSHPTWVPLIFCFSPTCPAAKSLTKALQAQSVSQEITQSSCDLYQATPYAVLSTVSGLLLLLIADDYARTLSKISGDTSTGSHLWTWHIMTQLSVATQSQCFYLKK